MAEGSYKRKLTAVFSADVVGYSRLMGEDEAATVRTLEVYKGVMSELIRQHRGRVVDSPGDNVLAEFASVVDAVQCAVAVQKELQARDADLPENRRMQFRIGINLGDVIEEEGRIYGDGVNIAARLEALAEAGGICVSKTAFDHIETKLPLGYQFLGEQTVKNIAKPVGAYKVLMERRVIEAEAEKGVRREARGVRGKPFVLGLLGAVVVLVGVAAVWQFLLRPSAPPVERADPRKMAFPLPDKPSIAVLPFDNLSGSAEQDYLADGLAENIMTALSSIPQMFVIARNSTFTYKGRPVKVQKVSEELGVRYVLEGSVQKSGERIRVTAQLVDALKGHHLWARRYDRELRDLFAIQDEITRDIVIALQVELTSGEQARMWHRGTKDLEAWGSLVKGMALFTRFTKEDNAKARALFEQAVNRDPRDGMAWTMLAWTHWVDGRSSYGDSTARSFNLAVEYAQKALALDETISDVHALLGAIQLVQRHYDKAIAEGQKSIDLGPSSATSHVLFGSTLTYAGRPEEAIELIQKGIRLTPHCPGFYLYHLGHAYTVAGRYEEALSTHLALLDRSKKEGSNVAGAHRLLAEVYAAMGRDDQAKAHAEEALRLDPNFNLEAYEKTQYYKDPAHLEQRLKAMRKAGLPDKPPIPLPDKPSIAVLPLVNMSDDPQQEFFGDGLAEEIINALAKLSQIFVIARNSSFTYKGKTVDAKQVGRGLGVKYVLEGSVRRDAQRVRITAQLIEAATGNHLFSERYDRELKDIFATQDEITIAIVRALRVTVTSGEQARLIGRGTKNLDAYLKAIQANEQFILFNRQGSVRAKELAMEAIALDPGYAYPHAILANAHMLDVWFRFSESPEESMRLAEDAAHTALALEKADPYVLGAMTNVCVMQRQYERAIASAERALEISPGSARSQGSMAWALMFACRFQEAIPFYEEALRLDPYPSGMEFRGLASAYAAVGRHDDALRALQKALRVNPTDIFTHLGLAMVYVELGREEEGRAAAKEVLRLHPKFSLEDFAKIFVAFKDPAFVDRRLELLRKAGLK